MIALVVSRLLGLYGLGPDLFARWLLGFMVPRKNLVQTKSEEITHGILWSIFPLFLAWILRHHGPLSLPQNSRIDLQVFFSGLYSESFFNQHRPEFFSAGQAFYALNVCIALRLYLIVLLVAVAFNVIIAKYGQIRHWLGQRRRSRIWSFVRLALSSIVLPRISEWHVILSPVLLPSKDMKIEVDVMTKDGMLYSGLLSEKALSGSGDLQSLTLKNPRRFRRDQYLETIKANSNVDVENFWKTIPGNLFVVVASEIATLNIRHTPATVRSFGREFKDIAKALRQVQQKVQAIQASKTPGRPPVRPHGKP